MSRLFKKRSHKTGLAPGALVHIGEEKTDPITIRVLDYDKDTVQELTCCLAEECLDFKTSDTVTWIDVSGIYKPELVKELGTTFDLHSLALEDILNTDQRSKYEDFKGNLFFVTKMLYKSQKDHSFIVEQVSFILGENYVLSFQETPEDIFEPVRSRIRDSRWRIRQLGADYLLYALIDIIVDNYFLILEDIGEAIESVEEAVYLKPDAKKHHMIHNLSREVVFLRKYILPMKQMLQDIRSSESSIINSETKAYFNDVYDHILQVIETIESFRGILDNLENRYLAIMSHKMNTTMQLLTVFSTIFLPLTFIVGVYGMNFDYMPELKWHWGYFAIWGVMILVSVTMFVFFKRKRLI